MIRLLGDIHGETEPLIDACRNAKREGDAAVFQLGDFGYFAWRNANAFHTALDLSGVDVYFIDGNHEDCTRWTAFACDRLHTIYTGKKGARLIYVPRGMRFELDGRQILCLGGAASIDKDYRLRQKMHWDPKENISQAEADWALSALSGSSVDLFFTHAPPQRVVDNHFDPRNKLFFGVPITWEDPNMAIVEKVWDKTGNVPIYSGHMHKSVIGTNYRILAIDEEVQV